MKSTNTIHHQLQQYTQATRNKSAWAATTARFFCVLAMTGLFVTQASASTAKAENKGDAPLNEGEVLFRAMEEKVLKAPSVQVVFKGHLQMAEKIDQPWNGTLVVGGKNQVNLSFNGQVMGPASDYQLVSDGANFRFIDPKHKAKNKKCPDRLSENLLRNITRYSTMPMRLIFPVGGEEKIAKGYSVSDIQLSRKEKLEGLNTTVITYKMQFAAHRRFFCTMWIDSTTQLPIKRVTSNGEGQQELMVEWFEDWKLGEALDEDIFKIGE